MKARIRKTGEIVEVICFNHCSTIRSFKDSVSYIDSKGVEHDRESLNYYWDFEPIETDTNGHWQDVRERAAIAAMQGMLANPELMQSTDWDGRSWDGRSYRWDIEQRAIHYADALIEELKKK